MQKQHFNWKKQQQNMLIVNLAVASEHRYN